MHDSSRVSISRSCKHAESACAPACAQCATYQVTVCVSPAVQTVFAVGFVMGGAIESRELSASGVATLVAAKARIMEKACMMAVKNMGCGTTHAAMRNLLYEQ